MCDPITIGIVGGSLLVGGAVGGTISKASGGSFWKGAAMGAVTGGIGVAIDRMTGGNLTGRKNVEREKKYAKQGNWVGAGKANPASSAAPKLPEAAKIPTQANASVQKAGTEERRAVAALGGYNIRTSSQGLGGVPNTAKKKLLGQ